MTVKWLDPRRPHLTPEQRSSLARKAALVRAGKRPAPQKAIAPPKDAPADLMKPIGKGWNVNAELARRMAIAREFLGLPAPASAPEEHRQRAAIVAAFPLALCCETRGRTHPGGVGKPDSFFSAMNRRNKRGE